MDGSEMMPWEEAQQAQTANLPPWEEAAQATDEPKSLAGFGKNLKTDAIANVKALVDNIKNGGIIGNVATPEKAYQFGLNLANYPKQLLNEAKHPIDSLYQRPVSTAMDVATVADLASPAIGKIADIARDSSIGLESRALGAQKRFRKTPFARGQVAEAAKTSLENNFFPLSGNPEVAEQNANNFLTKTGDQINQLRSSVGKQPTLDALKPSMDRLEELRQQLTKGSTGGKWDAIHKSIDTAQSTLLGLADRGETLDLNDIANARKQLGDALPWDSMGKATEKRINFAVEKGLEDAFKSSGGDVAQYKKLKNSYGSTKNALKYLSNEVAGQEGNGFPSFTGMVSAVPEAAQGAFGKAMAAMGITEVIKRRGPAIAAKLLSNIPSYPSPTLAPLLAALLTSGKNSSNGRP